MNLNYRRKLKRRLPNREKETLLTPNGKNISWSMDFVSDVLTNGRRFRVLNIIDDFNREAVAMEIGTSMPAERVIRIMEKVTLCYVQPGKPTQNSFIERFNGSYRKSILDSYLFDNLNEVRELTEQWMIDYNEHRPHESLGDISPKAYLEKMRLNETIREAI